MAENQVLLTRDDDVVTISTATYRLVLRRIGNGFDRSPVAHLSDAAGMPWTSISLLASVHTAATNDETYAITDPQFLSNDDAIAVTVEAVSSAWARKTIRIVCRPDRIEQTVSVAGVGAITDLTMLGGDAVLPGGATGTFRSAIRFAGVFSPTPSEPVRAVRPAHSSIALGVVGDAEPGRLNAVFSPPPLALGFCREVPASATEVPAGQWLGVSIVEDVRKLGFSTLRYEPVDGGFLLRMNYDGHTEADGEWTSPTIILKPATSGSTGWQVLDDYRDLVASLGYARTQEMNHPSWWLQPLFCGWGAQCARAADASRAGLSGGSAPDYARQDVYDELLSTIRAGGLEPGTIVLDDRWQASYGTAEPDLAHWPDLKGWIADRHSEGLRVLLWWKAWDPEGIPAEECVTDSTGRPVAVDPANPAYLARLSRIVHSLLGADGLDADGFKVDFTQRAPSGRTLAAHPGPWGIAGLHALLAGLYDSAKRAKSDALVITHTVHPSFGDVADVIRLNDVLERDVDGVMVPVVDQLRFRHQVASRVLPAHPIDTDQWPMPSKSEWLGYVAEQATLGIPALYYAESIDATGEAIDAGDLAIVARSWADYRARIAL
jgi:hypothetical protein